MGFAVAGSFKLVNLKLDDIELIHRTQIRPTGPATELRDVQDIQVVDRRNVIELRVPGAIGDVLQDMGREPIRISFTGQIWGPDANNTIQSLLNKYDARQSLPFSSDITTLADINSVIIEDLVVDIATGTSDRFIYRVALKEYKDPKPNQQEDLSPSQAKDAQKDTDDDSDVRGIRGVVLGPDGRPKQGVNVNVKSDVGQWQLTTDENGKYRMRDPAEGTYTITINEKGYEKTQRVIIIKKGST